MTNWKKKSLSNLRLPKANKNYLTIAIDPDVQGGEFKSKALEN